MDKSDGCGVKQNSNKVEDDKINKKNLARTLKFICYWCCPSIDYAHFQEKHYKKFQKIIEKSIDKVNIECYNDYRN